MLHDSSPRQCLQALLSSLLLSLTLLWSVTSQAAEPEETRWYDVEVIIFSQNSQQYRDSEMWPLDYDLPQLETTQELLPAPADPQAAPIAFSRLDAQSLRLTEQAGRIDTAADTELLLHLGWRQPGLAEDQAVPVRVDDSMQVRGAKPEQPATEDNPLVAEPVTHRMEGTLKLVLSRYLHIYTDLIYREPLAADSAVDIPAAGQGETSLFSLTTEDPFTVGLQPRYQVYHLQQSRRMRSRELHYLDHPVFGMVILVTPYEMKAADNETTSAQ